MTFDKIVTLECHASSRVNAIFAELQERNRSRDQVFLRSPLCALWQNECSTQLQYAVQSLLPIAEGEAFSYLAISDATESGRLEFMGNKAE